jgi:hypothetical protein
MKLDSPEGRSVVKLMNEYDPHVSMDLHTTNGSYHAYHLTYAPPLNQATDPAIIDLLRKQWLPAFTKSIKTKYGWDYYYYGNVTGGGRGGRGEGRGGRGRGGAAPGGRGDTAAAPQAAPAGERIWATFDNRPRFNNNYIGLRNRVAILSEAYSYATFADRITATNRFLDENLAYAAAHADAIRRLTTEIDKKPIVGTSLGLRAELERAPEPVDVLMGEVTEERNPYSGQMMFKRVDVRKPERMIEQGTFKATVTERVPSAYFVPSNLRNVIDRLQAHGIVTSTLQASQTLPVEEFRLEGIDIAAQPFQNRTERTLRGAWAEAERELPAGWVRVDLTQPLGRLAFYLIEPRSDDGLANWNLVDGLEVDAKVYPIARTRN